MTDKLQTIIVPINIGNIDSIIVTSFSKPVITQNVKGFNIESIVINSCYHQNEDFSLEVVSGTTVETFVSIKNNSKEITIEDEVGRKYDLELVPFSTRYSQRIIIKHHVNTFSQDLLDSVLNYINTKPMSYNIKLFKDAKCLDLQYIGKDILEKYPQITNYAILYDIKQIKYADNLEEREYVDYIKGNLSALQYVPMHIIRNNEDEIANHIPRNQYYTESAFDKNPYFFKKLTIESLKIARRLVLSNIRFFKYVAGKDIEKDKELCLDAVNKDFFNVCYLSDEFIEAYTDELIGNVSPFYNLNDAHRDHHTDVLLGITNIFNMHPIFARRFVSKVPKILGHIIAENYHNKLTCFDIQTFGDLIDENPRIAHFLPSAFIFDLHDKIIDAICKQPEIYGSICKEERTPQMYIARCIGKISSNVTNKEQADTIESMLRSTLSSVGPKNASS